MNTIQNKSKCEISFVATAFRTANWMNIYNSLSKNDINFEIVFVGPNKPNFLLPNNFHFIQSQVKPVQCVEIAMKSANGDLIVIIADDLDFVGERPIKKMLDEYKKINDYKTILSCRLMEDGKPFDLKFQRFDVNDESSPLVPIAGIMSRKLLNEVGGLDKRFIASMYDIDLSMRVLEAGGKIEICDVFINEDKKNKSEGSNTASEFIADRITLDKLWKKNGRVNLKRNSQVENFIDRHITLYSQGPRGRWRGRLPRFFEYLIDVYLKKITVFFRRLFSFHKYTYYAKKFFEN
jgi:GT2 family glycosyltransferase